MRTTFTTTPATTTGLVLAARGGSAAAWAELFTRYEDLVRCVVASFRLQDADAADAVQNTWLRAVERIDSIRDPERLGGWLRTTAGRECLALLRRSRRESPSEVELADVVADVPGPEARVLHDEAHSAVKRAVEHLEGRARLLVDMMFYQPGLGYAQVSGATGMPVGSIGPTRGRLLQSLRSDLERAGFGADPAVA
jgi:RNA polymerase sigma factor (sigma-70 family)